MLHELRHTLAGARGDREYLAADLSSAAAASTATVAARSSRSTLLTAIVDRHMHLGERLRDVAVARRRPLAPVEHQQRRIGALEFLAHPPSHALGQHVAGALHARQVDEHDLPLAASVRTPRIARRVVCGRSETIATLPPTIALTSVDLPTFGRPASATKPLRVSAASGSPAGSLKSCPSA